MEILLKHCFFSVRTADKKYYLVPEFTQQPLLRNALIRQDNLFYSESNPINSIDLCKTLKQPQLDARRIGKINYTSFVMRKQYHYE